MKRKDPKNGNGNTVERPNPSPTPDGPAQGLAGLMYQLLETEMGGVQVYRTALQCAINPELFSEWSKYLAETEHHVVVARSLVEKMGLDPDMEVPARLVCRHLADGLIQAMMESRAAGTPAEAQITAAECVVKAESKDHMNWELVGLLAKQTDGPAGEALRAAYEEIEPQEDHHVYHTTGWARELWVQALGLPAVLPPPEEKQDVESAMEAQQAKESARPEARH
jgi:hypothetical protein